MIPKIIYQCGPWAENEIPSYVFEYVKTWKHISADWDYKYFDDEMCIEDIRRIAGKNMSMIYEKIKRGDNRADFWRCIHLFDEGGFYADMDSKRINTIDSKHCETKNFICFRNTYPETGEIWENWFFGAEKNSKILEKIIEQMQEEINASDGQIDARHTFFPFSKAVNEFMHEDWFIDITNFQREMVCHIAAHDNWHNKNYFVNGGPYSE